jgi:hypothetical protein
MSIITEIRQLIKNSVVIRHRSNSDHTNKENQCIICKRELLLPPGALCLSIGNEGLLCTVCGEVYAPEMMTALGKEQPIAVSKSVSAGPVQASQSEWIEIAQDIEELIERTNDLARGISRGIVEAPAGHIGLMHYAKDLQKPPRKEHESEKEYELRIRTHRMTYLLEKIQADTIGRINRIASFLHRLGMPDLSR